MVTHHPLHGSGRAAFPHPALASGHDAKSPQGVGVTDAGRGQPAVDEPPHPVPEDLAVLAAPRQRAMPEPAHLKPEPMERRAVHAEKTNGSDPLNIPPGYTRDRSCGSIPTVGLPHSYPATESAAISLNGTIRTSRSSLVDTESRSIVRFEATSGQSAA